MRLPGCSATVQKSPRPGFAGSVPLCQCDRSSGPMLSCWELATWRVVVDDVAGPVVQSVPAVDVPRLLLRYQRPLNRVAPWPLLAGSLWAAWAFHRYDVSVTSSLFASKAPAIGQAATRPLTCSVPAQYSPATRWSAPLRS